MAIQPNNKVVVVGTSDPNIPTATGNNFLVVRYTDVGALDTSFGGGDGFVNVGTELFDPDATNASGRSVALQADGKIVAGGSVTDPSTSATDFVVVRLNSNGTADTTFDAEGVRIVGFTSLTDIAGAVAIQTDAGGTQKIIAVGSTGSNGDIGIARFDATGSLDPSFDVDGKTVIPVSVLTEDGTRVSGVDRVPGLAIQTLPGATPGTYSSNIIVAGTGGNVLPAEDDKLVLASVVALEPAAAPGTVYVDEADPAVGWNIWTDLGPTGLSYGDTVNNGTVTRLFGVDAFSTFGNDPVHSVVGAIAGVNTGGTVNVFDGTYFESNIAVNKPVTVDGQSQAYVFVGPGIADTDHANNGFNVTAANVTIQDLTVDGNEDGLLDGDNQFRAGIINTAGANGMTVQDVTVQNVYRRGIQISPVSGLLSTGHKIINATVKNLAPDTLTDQHVAIVAFNADVEITGGTIDNAPHGIQVIQWSAAAPWAKVRGVTLTNVREGIQLAGPAANSIIGGPDAGNNNHITLSSSATIKDAAISIRSAYGTATIQNNDVTVKGLAAGIVLFGNGDATHPTIIDGNQITFGGTGLSLADGIFMSDDGSLFPNGDGNAVADASNYATISGNTISGFATGINLAHDPLASTSVVATISNNTGSIHGNAIGIDVSGGSATISGNDIYDNSTAGIRISGGTASIDDNNFDGAADNATDILLTGGTITGGTLTGNTFAGTLYIDLQTTQDLTALRTVAGTNSYNGAADDFRIEDRMHHKVDTDLSVTNGLVTWVAGNLYVTDAGTDHSIQRGIDAADPTNTVNVEAGNYAERLSIGKSLTLLGARSGVDARGRTGAESIVTEAGLPDPNPNVLVEVSARTGTAPVVIDGFTLNGDRTDGNADTSVVRAWGSDVTVRNDIIDGRFGVIFKGGANLSASTNAFTTNTTGVAVQPSPANNVAISNNTFVRGITFASDARPIYMTGVTGGSITGNVATGFTGGEGIQGSNNQGVDGAHPLLISGNNFSGNKKGISLWGNTQYVSITGNTLTNNSGSGIEIKGDHLNISGNTIAGNATGILLDKNTLATTDVSISGNDFRGATVGTIDNGTDLKITAGVASFAVGAGNLFAGNTYFIDNQNAQNIDLTSYTSANFEGLNPSTLADNFRIEDKMHHKVDTDNTSAGTIYWVAQNVYVTGPLIAPVSTDSSIQQGINAAANGDTVNVEAGIYTEPLNIDTRSNLTLLGAGRTSTLIAPATVLPWNVSTYGASRQTGVRVVNSTNIAMQGVSLDMNAVKANNVYGMLWWDSWGGLTESEVKNLSVSDALGGYYEFGAYVRAIGSAYSPTSRAQVTFHDNLFTDTGRVGILAHDNVDVLIDQNRFTKTFDDFGYAMEIGSTATAMITGNTISEFDTPAASDGSSSGGIYIENCFTYTVTSPAIAKPVTISGNNEVYNSQIALMVGNQFDGYAGNVDMVLTVEHNRFHDNEYGVVVSDEDALAGSSVTASFHGNTLTDNGTGYCIYTAGDGNITAIIDGDTITGGTTGIELDTATATVRNSTLSGQTDAQVRTDTAGSTITNNQFLGTMPVDGKRIDATAAYDILGLVAGNTYDTAVTVRNASSVYQPAIWANIQGGVNAAVAGEIVQAHDRNADVGGSNVASTYVEGPQIVLSRDVSIVGMGATRADVVVKPSANTTDVGDDTSAWFLANTGVTANFSNLTLDGTDKQVDYAILHKGSGTIDNVHFTHIQHGQWLGFGLRARGAGTIDVLNSSLDNIGRVGLNFRDPGRVGNVTNVNYTGKGAGVWLDYAVEAGGGAHVIITGSSVSKNLGVANADDTSAGFYATTFFGTGTELTVRNSPAITNNVRGIALGYAPGGSDTTTAILENNTLTNNGIGVDVFKGSVVTLTDNAINSSLGQSCIIATDTPVLNLTHNSLTGLGSGGSLTNVGTVNWKTDNDTTTGNDTFTVNATQMLDNANNHLGYTGVTNLNVYTLGGDDIVTVQETGTIITTVDGGTGSNTLNYKTGDNRDDVVTVVVGTPEINNTLDGSTVQKVRFSISNIGIRNIYTFGGNDIVTVGLSLPASTLGFNIYGGEGNDILRGGAGNDRLYGEGGNDRLDGLKGNDYLDGGDGNDSLYGGDGNDYLIAGAGRNMLFGQNGNDIMDSRNGSRDVLAGGAGYDKAKVDAIDLRTDIEELIESIIWVP